MLKISSTFKENRSTRSVARMGSATSACLILQVQRAENKVSYDPEATVATVAASLAWGLIKNHAFIDGNKRIGLVALVVFLRLNGHALQVPTVEITAMVLRAAASEISEQEWTAWVVASVAQVKQ